jgi:hypothetical protein
MKIGGRNYVNVNKQYRYQLRCTKRKILKHVLFKQIKGTLFFTSAKKEFNNKYKEVCLIPTSLNPKETIISNLHCK